MIKKLTLFTAALLITCFCFGQTFNYTGSVQYFVVPNCTDSISVQAWGGGGSNSMDRSPTSHDPGKGAYVTGTFNPVAGDTLWIYVGGAGDTNGNGGFNGGGKGGNCTHGGSCSGNLNAGGGGGASDVRDNSKNLSSRVIVAGGGGGAGRDYCNGTCQPCGCGGSGGAVDNNGFNGSAAFNCGFGYPGTGINYGAGGTQVSGGAGGPGDGSGNPGTAGTSGSGGTGANGSYDVAGGGGGGGYYGGGGGGGASSGSGVGGGGGGGGSSYITGLTGATVTDSVNSGNGKVILTVYTSSTTSVVAKKTDILCNGNTNGTAKAYATCGTSPFTFSWSTGATTTSISGLSAGTYTVTMTDASSNTATASVTISQPPVLSVSVGSVVNVKCKGSNTGGATATPTGGTPSYSYSWAPGGNTNASPTTLAAGTYTVTVTDANGCTATASTTITQPATTMSVSITSTTNILCNGGNTGSATVTATGTSGYTYSWSPSGGTSATANNLFAGTYTVTVTDANGCVMTASTTITQPAAITATGSKVNVLCNGGNTGSISITPSGGTPSYTYSWSPTGQTSATASGLTAGTYTVTITDANGCTKTVSASITEPTALTATTTNTNLKCFGNKNGTASVTASGGTPGYTYAWSPSGGTNNTASGLSAGTYTVTTTDNNGCTASASVTITEPAAFKNIVTPLHDSLCTGGCVTLSSSPTGGTPGYNYAWNTGATTSSINVCPTTTTSYTSFTTDANGCSSDSVVKVVVNPLPSVTLKASKDTICNTLGVDSLTGSPLGGTYSGAGVTGNNFNATTAGVGTHTITYVYSDVHGCTDSAKISIIVSNCTGINEVSKLDNEVKCYPDPFTGSLNVNITTSGDSYLTIFNVLGESQGTYMLKTGANTINTQNLPSGVYIMQIKNNGSILNKKLMKVN